MPDYLEESLANALGRPLYDRINKYLADGERAEQAVARIRALHPEGADGRCEFCYVPWPCPDICALNGPPGCRNCGEYHTPIADGQPAEYVDPNPTIPAIPPPALRGPNWKDRP